MIDCYYEHCKGEIPLNHSHQCLEQIQSMTHFDSLMSSFPLNSMVGSPRKDSATSFSLNSANMDPCSGKIIIDFMEEMYIVLANLESLVC